jgi:hypothetical protein
MNNYYSYESFDNVVNGTATNSKLDEPIAETTPATTPTTTPPAVSTIATTSAETAISTTATTTPPSTVPAIPAIPANVDTITLPTPTTVYHSISCMEKKLTDFGKLNKATKIADTDIKNIMGKCPATDDEKPPEPKELTGICKLSPYIKGFFKNIKDITTSVYINYVILAIVIIILIIYSFLGNSAENDTQTKQITDL